MHKLCVVEDLAEGECREFDWEGEERRHSGFVVRWQGQLHAYRNHCPHTGAPLNWQPEQFLSPDGDRLMCAMHGALFEIDGGQCIYGPCQGQALTPLAVEVRQGCLYLLE